MTIDHDEYMNLIQIRDSVKQEVAQLKRKLIQQEDEIKFLKDMGENVLIVVKDEAGKSYEFKSHEKEALLELVESYNNLREDSEGFLKEILNLQQNIHKIQVENREQLENYLDQIEILKGKIKDLRKRTLWQRIRNMEPDD